jgi:hypothetical protein
MRPPEIVAVLAILILAGCGQAARPGFADPVVGTTISDGVSVTLAVTPARVAPGGDVTAIVAIRNAGQGPITWQGGGCDLQSDVSVTPIKALPELGTGVVIGDGGAAVRALVLPDAYQLRWPSPPELAHADLTWGCPPALTFHSLGAGEEARAEIVWVASTIAGSSAPAGDYVVDARFPYVGRGLANASVDMLLGLELHLITARVTISVDAGRPAPGPEDAVDAILAAPGFGEALERHPRRTWESTQLRWIDGAWVVQVRYAPGGLLEGRFDAGSGRVLIRDGPG